jgi:hypothetical protein
VGELLDRWKTRSLPKGTYGDLYEGQVWEDILRSGKIHHSCLVLA